MDLREERKNSMGQGSTKTVTSVLIVEDNENMREVLALILSRRGHRCETAANGRDAMLKIKQGSFDAVVTDVEMPEMDGIALTNELTRHHPRLPVMIITGNLDDSNMELAFSTCGAREFLKKPFDASEFVEKFHKMLLLQGPASDLTAQRR